MILLPPANEACEGYVFTRVCLSTGEGACVVGAHVWQGGMCDRGRVWQGWGMCGGGGHVTGGMCGRGCAW